MNDIEQIRSKSGSIYNNLNDQWGSHATLHFQILI